MNGDAFFALWLRADEQTQRQVVAVLRDRQHRAYAEAGSLGAKRSTVSWKDPGVAELEAVAEEQFQLARALEEVADLLEARMHKDDLSA